jgi:hypothetical protein
MEKKKKKSLLKNSLLPSDFTHEGFEASTLKFFLKSSKYPGGKFKVISTLYPFSSAKHISLAKASL